MITDLADNHPEVRQLFAIASEVLGKDLWQLVAQDPENELNQTHNTQPALLAAGVALWQAWCRQSTVRPAWLAGHSLGEYTALVCANALSFEDGIKLVAQRGLLMQEAVPADIGAMAAILGLDDAQIIEICAAAAEDEVVSAVNFNSPGQVVIAGNKAAVERAMLACKAAGAKRALPLPVSVPSHCALMLPAAEKLDSYLQNTAFNTPDIKLLHNVDVASHDDPAAIRAALKQQLYQPVRWVDSIQFMADQGVTRFVECGPGKVLIGLNKRIAKAAEHFSFYDNETLNNTVEQLHD
jgi:[acyl-carrier-protein] S-malonyltransferase